ncbi:MAG: radical SAM protein [Deltaproteobacteria bacterium]|nr:radical SAM protein [Deltaproteobacteria bacterium]
MPDASWIDHRKRLHDRYMEVARVGDASRLSYLHGPTTVWSEEEVAALWERAARHPIGELEPRNCVYIHVPFCKSICSFCNYDRLQPSSSELLRTWLKRALRTIEVIAPALQPLTFHALYIGGGTPAVLPAPLLHELLDAVDSKINWHPGASRKLEFDPAVMNRARLDVLVAHGFKQLSFGIETLDPQINERHNRGKQGIETIERSFADLKAVGLNDVACDFLLGLEGTTAPAMLIEMETVMQRFRPQWLDIFMLTPTQRYIDQHFAGSHEAFWAHLKPFEELIPPALPALAERHGYQVRMGSGHHMMLRRQEMPGQPVQSGSTFTYTALSSEARRPLNVFGIGRSARSVIFGSAAFSLRDPDDNPAAPGPADYEGNRMSLADEARTFLTHHLRDNDTVDRTEFRQIFGGDIAAVIPAAIEAWEHEGVARLETDVLRFTAQDRRARIATLLWLVPQEAIEFDLAHFDAVELSARGVGLLVENLPSGTELAGGHRFVGTDGVCLLLRTPGGETLRLRVAPALAENGNLRLVLEAAPRQAPDDSLRLAVAQLRGAITRNHRAALRRRARRDQQQDSGAAAR